MPREVVVVDYCDSCFASDVKREAVETFVLSIGGAEWTYLGCEEHAEPVQQALDLVQGHGASDKKKRGGTGRPVIYDGPMNCPLCDAPHVSRKAWRQHLKQQHRLTIAQLHEQHPEVAA